MKPTKKEFFALSLNEEIIQFQVDLWNKYCDARNQLNINWQPEKLTGAQIKFSNKVKLYQQKNDTKWSPILALVRDDMKKQGESFAPFDFVNHNPFQQSLIGAHDWLTRQNNAMSLALKSFINKVIIVHCDDLVACTSIKFMGIIVIAPKTTWCFADYVENLTHEMSHIDLYIRQIIDPLVEKNVLLESPLRKNKRPTIGVFHAAFVLSRVVHSLACLLNEQHETELTRVRMKNNYQSLMAALSTLKQAPFLTDIAKMLLDEMNEHSLQYKEFLL